MADISSLHIREHNCPSCGGHIPNGEKSWMSGSIQQGLSSTMSQFKASRDDGCLVCSIIFRSVQAIEPEMISQNAQAQICIGSTIKIRASSLDIPWGIIIYASPEVPKRWPGMAVGPRQVFAPTLASDSCFVHVRKWISECVNTHTHAACQQSAMPVLPSRVLDVGSTSSIRDLRLLTTHGKSGKYIALSHRWGIDQTFSTKKASLLERENSIDFDALPKTFQDAIIVARSIDVRYLWIDSLCIIQDDAEDWEKESSKMGQIYTDAFLTIAAASASSDLEGFLLHRESVAGLRLHSLENTSGEPDIIVQRQVIHSDRERDPDDKTIPLWSRAWTLQEDILSRRLLTYHYDEMTWECNTAPRCECGSELFLETDFTGPRIRALIQKSPHISKTSQVSQEPGCHLVDSHTKLYSVWRGLVARYTTRNLTKRSDTLAALSGIATTMQYSLKDQYIGGIWKGDLIRELVWGVASHYISCVSFGQLPSDYRAPSFCWASVDSPGIKFPDVNLKYSQLEHKLEPKILDAQFSTRRKDPMGDLSSGYLKIYALIFDTSFRFKFFRSNKSTGNCRIQFYPDTILKEVDVKLPSGDSIHTAQRSPKMGNTTRYRFEITHDEFIFSLVDQLGVFESPPDDIDKIQIWSMLVCDSSAVENRGRWMVGDNSNGYSVVRSFHGIFDFSPYHAYWLLVLGRSLSKPQAFERLGLLALLTEEKGYIEWAKKGVLKEIEII